MQRGGNKPVNFFSYCLMKQGGKSNRGRTARSQSQLFPAMGQKAAPVGSSATFFKVTGPEGKVPGLSLAHISPFLPADLASLPFQLQHCERFCKLRGKAGKRC